MINDLKLIDEKAKKIISGFKNETFIFKSYLSKENLRANS